MALGIFLSHVSLKKFCETIILTELDTVLILIASGVSDIWYVFL